MGQTSLINDIKHRLLRGESIAFIAQHLGIPEESIKRAFNLKPGTIKNS